jgi:hypothetical protein
LRTHFVFIAVEQVVVSDGDIEEVARRNSLRIMIIVFFEGGRYLQKERLELRRWACAKQRLCRGRTHGIAAETSLKLLIG